MAKKVWTMEKDYGCGRTSNYYYLRDTIGVLAFTFAPKHFERYFPEAKLRAGQSCRVTIDIRKVE